jgi:hypothetical protein
LTTDGLEFGSFYVFRNSWLLLGGVDYHNVRARVRFRFQEHLARPEPAFLGVSVRNQHFHANWGHMLFVRANLSVARTEPEDDRGTYHDVEVGRVPEDDYSQSGFVDLEVAIDNKGLRACEFFARTPKCAGK